MAQLHERISFLEQENTRLRLRLEQLCGSCRSCHKQTLESCEPAQANQQLNSSDWAWEHHLLEATVKAANALLTIARFDAAVNTALQIIGETLETDRVKILECVFDEPANPYPTYYTMSYEWITAGTISQLDHPGSSRISNAGAEAFMEENVFQNNGFGGLLQEWPEVFWSAFEAVQAKGIYCVPIRVEGQLWGVLVYDDCHQAKHRHRSELAVLKIAANAIGSAIQRQRMQQALLQAAQNQAAELAKVNEALRRGVERLAEAGDIDVLLDSFLLEAMTVTGASAGAVFDRVVGTEFQMRSLAQGNHLINPADTEAFGDRLRSVSARDPVGVFSQIVEAQVYCHAIDDYYASSFPEAAAFHRQQGNQVTWNFPFQVGRQVVGYLGLAFREYRLPNQVVSETVQALGHQVSLALETLRLAEEAKQAAITREQELAATERAAELAKANEALKRSLTLLAHEPSLDKFLGYVLQTVADQLSDRSGAVYLYSHADHTSLIHLNYENGQLQQGDRITHPAATLPNPPRAWDEQYLPLLYQNQLLIHHACELDSLAYAPYHQHNRAHGIQTLLFVPLLFGDQLLGILTLRSTQHREYTPEELELARALAQQATLAIQLTQLAEQRRQTAVLEERNRMARDIHDSLAQSFTGIIMQLEATKKLLPGNHLDIQASFDCIDDLARLGLAEARRSIRALRLEALETADFSTALHRLLRQMTQGTSTRATLAVEGVTRPLPPELEENLLRIAQEALTNAMRHGHAQNIALQLLFEPTAVHLQIVDDGEGFEPQRISFSGFGLLGMQERVDQLHGQFHLVS